MKKILSMIPEYKDGVIYFLKFSNSRDNLEQLQNGRLYMNNLGYYVDLEKKTDKKGMGDVLEASAVINRMTDAKLISNETGEVIFEGDVPRITFRKNAWLEQPVFCTATIASNILEIINETETNYEVRALFTDEQKDKFPLDFGENVLLINAADFVRRIKKCFHEEKISHYASFVKYDDFSINNKQRLLSFINENIEIFFWKDQSLSYQMEHRLVILDKNVQTPFVFELGDLSSFSKLMTAEELFNEDMIISIQKS